VATRVVGKISMVGDGIITWCYFLYVALDLIHFFHLYASSRASRKDGLKDFKEC
jgi:hypothetical protein